MEVQGYFLDVKGELKPTDVFVALGEDSKCRIEVYCPIGQHSQADKDYVKECTEITKEQYKEASKGYYTPEDYL